MKTYTIGRDAQNQIVLNDNFVSRHHAQLTVLDNGQVILKDLGSANGSFVNGNKITEVYLKPGDIVKCGGAFLSWSQYANINVPIANNDYPFENRNEEINQLANENTDYRQFSLGETWKYLTTKIFNAGDLIKTDWNRTFSILFFLITPLIITFVLLLYLESNIQYNVGPFIQYNLIGNKEIIHALIVTILMFGVSQFLTFGLMSINRKITANKILFASSIFSFLQFIPFLLLIFGSTSNLFSKHNDFNNSASILGYFFLALLVITILISSLVSTIIFIYKYFRTIGVSKGISIHFTIISFTLNLLIQSILLYVFILIIQKNYQHNF